MIKPKKKINITISFDIDNFYEDEGLSKKESLEKCKEDFSNIEILLNHLNGSNFNVTAKYKK